MDVDGTRGPSLRDRLYRLAYSGNTLTSHAHSPRTYTPNSNEHSFDVEQLILQ